MSVIALLAGALAMPASTTPPAQASPDRLAVGAFAWPAPYTGLGGVDALESAIGADLEIVQWYQSWERGGDPTEIWTGAWSPRVVREVADAGYTPLITWESFGVDLGAITAGAWDDYIATWAQGVRAHGDPVYLRIFPEMNGDWHDWNGDPAGVVAAWRHIAARFEAAGADNVRWVWSPYAADWPNTEANRMERYYPGSDVVDILAVDGFNWGRRGAEDMHYWLEFDEIFAEPYRRLSDLGPQPIWIAEIGSAEQGGDKAAWIRNMFTDLATGYDRIEALIWFEGDKERDWRITSSPASTAAFREGLARLREGPPAAEVSPPDVDRLAGPNRWATAAAIATAAHPDGTDHVYLARGEDFPDALAASNLTDGPLLLVPSCNGLPDPVSRALTHLAPDDLTALGGPAAICDDTLRAAQRSVGG